MYTMNINVSQCLELDPLSMYVQGHTGHPKKVIGPLSKLKVLDVEMTVVIQYDHLEMK